MTCINSLLVFVVLAALAVAQHESMITVEVVSLPGAPNLQQSSDKLKGMIDKWSATEEASKTLRGQPIKIEIIAARTEPDLAFLLRITKPGYKQSRQFTVETKKGQGIEEAFEISKKAIRVYIETPAPLPPQHARKIAFAPAAAPTPQGRPAAFVFQRFISVPLSGTIVTLSVAY